jgi:hypothetical protein
MRKDDVFARGRDPRCGDGAAGWQRGWKIPENAMERSDVEGVFNLFSNLVKHVLCCLLVAPGGIQ